MRAVVVVVLGQGCASYPRRMTQEWERVIVGSAHHRPVHVDAVDKAIDAVDPAGDKVVLVGYSAGRALARAAVDAWPVELGRAIFAGIERQ
jgi:hypothetical protein